MMFPPYRWRWTRGVAGWKPQGQLRFMRESSVHFAKLWSARGVEPPLWEGGGIVTIRSRRLLALSTALPNRGRAAAALQSAAHETTRMLYLRRERCAGFGICIGARTGAADFCGRGPGLISPNTRIFSDDDAYAPYASSRLMNSASGER